MGPDVEAPVGPVVAPVTSHVTCPSLSVCVTWTVIVPEPGTVPVQSNWPPASALTSLGQSTVMPVVLSLRVQLVLELRLEPAHVERLAARDGGDGDGEQDGGACEPWAHEVGVLSG